MNKRTFVDLRLCFINDKTETTLCFIMSSTVYSIRLLVVMIKDR